MSPPNENSLATRPSLLARLGDWSQDTAWREFDRAYAQLLRNLARKAGLTEVEADEVSQETLIALALKIGEFQHNGKPGAFRAWLYQQARWRIADRFRARARSGRVATVDHLLSHDGSGAGGDNSGESAPTVESFPRDPAAPVEVDLAFERLWEAQWEQHLRDVALARVKRRVSARQFQLFELHAVQGLSVRETAAAAGATVAAVYMSKSRVQRLFERELKAAASEEG